MQLVFLIAYFVFKHKQKKKQLSFGLLGFALFER